MVNAPVNNQSRPVVTGIISPLQESKNNLEHPTGPEFQLQLSEGTYVLRDDLILGAVPPHPSEPLYQNNNVLDNRPVPPSAGTRISLAILAPRKATTLLRPMHSSSTYNLSLPPSISENPLDSSLSGGGDHESNSFSPFRMGAFGARFGVANGALSFNNRDARDPAKRKKPKSSMTKSSSSFVSRAVQHENLSKRLAEHSLDGAFAIVNVARAVHWLDLSSANKADQLTKILFAKAHALCHDFNEFTKTSTHVDIVMGFSTADIIWYEPISQKYSRINKNGVMNASPVTEIRWLPNSENLFIAAHLDGTLVVYDKDKDDGAFTPEDQNGSPARMSNDGKRIPRLRVRKSIQTTADKLNPVAVWKVTNQRINGMEFSPEGSMLAVASEDGALRLYDYMKEQ